MRLDTAGRFWQNNAERLIVGNGWASTNWSLDAGGNQLDLTPIVPIALNEWQPWW